MKNLLITLSVLFAFTPILVSQNTYDIVEQQLPMNKFATSFSANIIGVNENFVIYNWQKFIEKHKGTTYLMSFGEGEVEFESEHVTLPFMNNQIVSLHSRIGPDNTKTGVTLTIWILLPDGKYFSNKTDKSSAIKIKNWLLQFDQQLMDKNNLLRE